jgi:hypothetical protein
MPLVEFANDLRKRFPDFRLLLLLGQGFERFHQRQPGFEQGQKLLAEQDQRKSAAVGPAPHQPASLRLDRDDCISLILCLDRCIAGTHGIHRKRSQLTFPP